MRAATPQAVRVEDAHTVAFASYIDDNADADDDYDGDDAENGDSDYDREFYSAVGVEEMFAGAELVAGGTEGVEDEGAEATTTGAEDSGEQEPALEEARSHLRRVRMDAEGGGGGDENDDDDDVGATILTFNF